MGARARPDIDRQAGPDAGPAEWTAQGGLLRGGAAREEISFASAGERCAAWLYPPAGGGPGPHPCVILAHGFTMVREARLDAYAERFAAAGLAAFVFDYRHFGSSDGEPRQLLDIPRQLEDWRSAIAFVRGRGDLDTSRIGLWGTSFSGGHVVALAAEDPAIAAVVSQVPFAGMGRRAGRPRVGFLLRMLAAAVLDEVCGRLGRTPHYIPASGPPGTFAALEGGELSSLVPPGSTWVNRFTPRVMLRAPAYRPFDRAEAIRCPVLVCVCEHDTVTPAATAAAGAARAPLGELRSYPIGHFDIYLGEWFDRAAADQADFLRGCLGTPTSA